MMTKFVDCTLGGDMYYFAVFGFSIRRGNSNLTR